MAMKIAFIGLGNMGGNLVKAGHIVNGFEERREPRFSQK